MKSGGYLRVKRLLLLMVWHSVDDPGYIKDNERSPPVCLICGQIFGRLTAQNWSSTQIIRPPAEETAIRYTRGDVPQTRTIDNIIIGTAAKPALLSAVSIAIKSTLVIIVSLTQIAHRRVAENGSRDPVAPIASIRSAQIRLSCQMAPEMPKRGG